MMEIKVRIAGPSRYSVADHIEFHLGAYAIVNRNKSILNAQSMIDDYKQKVDQENEIYKWMRLSEYTGMKADTDRERDKILTGITGQLRYYDKHFDPDVRKSALHLLHLVENYHNLEHADYDAETAGIDSILQRIATAEYSGDAVKLGMQSWFTELGRLNTLFKSYVDSAAQEKWVKPEISPKTARRATDEALRKLTARLTAIITIDGPEDAQPLLVEYNTLADHYNSVMKEHYGRLHARIDISGGNIEPIGVQDYTGDTVDVIPKVSVPVTREGKTTVVKLVFSVDFTVRYKDNIGPGTATLYITGIGKYTGEIITTFNISG